MTCQAFDDTLDALLDGRCAPAEWTEAEAHVSECARCRRIFEAMSGKAGELDDEGHEALAAAVVAKTTGGERSCASAHERLCTFVDGELEPFDRELVEGHLAHCATCSALAGALASQAEVLPAFAGLAPRHGFVGDVLAATSRRPIEPTVTERIAAWLSRVAQRPRFAMEAAYVMTVLLLVVFGNPVDAFRETSVRVQPGVSAVTGAVSRPLNDMRAAGAARLSRVEQALAPKQIAEALADKVETLFQQQVVKPAQSLLEQVWAWTGRVFDALHRAFAAPQTEPPPTGVR